MAGSPVAAVAAEVAGAEVPGSRQPGGPVTDGPDDLVTVKVYPFRAEADIAVARLAADGIRAVVHQDDEAGLNPGFFKIYGVRVEVAAGDVEDAFESLGIERISVPREVATAMFQHARWAFPNESCGLIGVDDDGGPVFAFCLTNADESEHRFTIEPREHFGAMRLAEAMGFRIGGVFHSHVRAEAVPSRTDIENAADPDWLHFIIGSMADARPLLRGYRIVGGEVTEVSVSVHP